MSPQTDPKIPISLARLRKIAWDDFDPLDLRAKGWNRISPDEYTKYMKTACVLLLHGSSAEQAAEYLHDVILHKMDIDPDADTRHRAIRTATSLKNALSSKP